MVCDNCKREFEKFDLEGSTDKGFGFVVREGDIDVLMDDLTFAFCCFTEIPEEREKDCEYWCVKCVESVNDTD